LEQKDPDGNPIFHVVDWRPICPACKHKEVRTKIRVRPSLRFSLFVMPRQVEKCPHKVFNALDFRSRSDQDRVEALMRPFGGYEQEMLNMRVGADPTQPRSPTHSEWQATRASPFSNRGTLSKWSSSP
jgi:hypothetical protein